MNGVDTRQGRGFTDCELPRIVLLELRRRAHAVIAKAGVEGRGFLAHLERAMASLDHIGRFTIGPGVLNVIRCCGDEVAVGSRCGLGGQPGDDGANQPIVLPGRHEVVNLVSSQLAIIADGQLDIGDGSRRLG